MKKFGLLLLSLLLISCTKNLTPILKVDSKDEEQQKKVQNITNSVIITDDKVMGQNEPDVLNFGEISAFETKKMRLYLKNNREENLVLNILELENSIISTPYSIIKNTCPNSLKQHEVCYIDVNLVYDNNYNNENITFNLFQSEDNDHFGTFILMSVKKSTIINKNIDFVKIGHIDNIDSNNSIRVYLKNIGDQISNATVIIPNELKLNKTTCQGILKTHNFCFLDLSINEEQTSNINGINKFINYDGIEFAIQAGIPTASNSISCITNYSNVNNTCELTNQIRNCDSQPLNSIEGYQETNNGGITWSSCQGYQCITSHIMINNLCIEKNQQRNCTIPPPFSLGGQEYSIDGGQSWGTCQNFTCEPGYYSNGESCLSKIGVGGIITYTDSNGLNPRTNTPYINGYVVHKFTTVGNSTLILNGPARTAEVLVIAGGGAGGATPYSGGGGGAGGVLHHNSYNWDSNVSITVGAGGIGVVNGDGTDGSDSFFGQLRAFGGGAGKTGGGALNRKGGSGGGSGHTNPGEAGGLTIQTSNNGAIGYGNVGGSSYYGGTYPSGSGGGAGSAGGQGANGGAGRSFNITGILTTYAGGGGTVDNSSNTTLGGIGGGGNARVNTTGNAGVQNTGSGGGAAKNAAGGAGGSGIVIIKYPYN